MHKQNLTLFQQVVLWESVPKNKLTVPLAQAAG
jgi:hypothetical protein